MAANSIPFGTVLTTVVVVLALGTAPAIVPAAVHDAPTSTIGPAAESQPEYNVTFSSTTIGELVLRNVLITDVRVGEVTVDEMTVGNETTENVELENVTLDRLNIERAIVENVSTGELSVRNKSVLNVPGGELIGNAGDRSLERHVIDNLTVDGVEIDRIHLANLTVEADLQTVEDDVEEQPDGEPAEEPAVSIGESEAGTATVTNASFERGAVENASVEDETVTPDANGDDESDDGGDNGEDDSDGDDNGDTNEELIAEQAISQRIGR